MRTQKIIRYICDKCNYITTERPFSYPKCTICEARTSDFLRYFHEDNLKMNNSTIKEYE